MQERPGAASGEPEHGEFQRVLELLTDQGGYISTAPASRALTLSYRLSGENLKAVSNRRPHPSRTALRYQRAHVDYLAAIAANLSNMIENDAKP